MLFPLDLGNLLSVPEKQFSAEYLQDISPEAWSVLFLSRDHIVVWLRTNPKICPEGSEAIWYQIF